MASTRFRPVKSAGAQRRRPAARFRGYRLGPFLTPFLSLVLVFGLAFYWLDVKVRPVVMLAAKAIATRAATEALNEAVTEEIAHDADYSRIVELDNGPDGHLQVARFNFASVTQLQSAATQQALTNLRALSADSLELPVGQVLAGPLIGNAGPRLPIHLYVVGSAHSSVTTDVKSVGVNQTVHILYLDLSAEVSVVAPLITTPVRVQSRVPLAYIVLAGRVPNTYLYNGSGSVPPLLPAIPSGN